MSQSISGWDAPDPRVLDAVRKQTRSMLAAYEQHPISVREHANMEQSTAYGGYERRQVYELIQNASDALLPSTSVQGRIQVVLTDSDLYCANEGDPIDVDGVVALMTSHVSAKRGREIGRFGLGFKSVLGVSRSPKFYSRSGSFEFDRSVANQKISKVVPNEANYPVLRVAEVINDPVGRAEDDAVLAELMPWATTVVQLPRDGSGEDVLSEDVEAFDAEIMLALEHVGTVMLHDRTMGVRRTIKVTESDGVFDVVETRDGWGLFLHGQSLQASPIQRTARQWRTFACDYSPTPEAIQNAGPLVSRSSVPLLWAVPTKGRQDIGQFFAYFPTNQETTMRGILNAPWKTNEDRTNLLKGVFNQELLTRFAELSVEALPSLVDHEDPGSYLTLLPARGREPRNWADEEFTKLFYARARMSPSLPDLDGVLRLPDDVRLHPAKLTEDVLRKWDASPDRPSNWCHHKVDLGEPTRRSRANRLKLLEDGPEDAGASVTDWLEALVEAGTAQASAGAIAVVAQLLKDGSHEEEEVTCARVVLTEDKTFVECARGKVFLPVSDTGISGSGQLVHRDVIRQAGAVDDLRSIGITPADMTSTFVALVQQDPDEWSDARWEEFWEAARHVNPEEVFQAAEEWRDKGVLKVRSCHGSYQLISQLFFPGRIVPGDGSRDPQLAVDKDHHREHEPVLVKLGLTDGPREFQVEHAEGSRLFRRYRDFKREQFAMDAEKRLGTKPQLGMLCFDQDTVLGPLINLRRLSDEGCANFTAEILSTPVVRTRWKMSHSSAQQNEKYGEQTFESFDLWRVRHQGKLRTSLGVRRVNECVGRELHGLHAVLPVIDEGIISTDLLDLPSSTDLLTSKHWEGALAALEGIEDPSMIGDVYVHMCGLESSSSKPREIRSCVSDGFLSKPPEDVTVAADPDVFTAIVTAGQPCIRVRNQLEVQLLASKWGLQTPKESTKYDIGFTPASDADQPFFLRDRFKGLQYVLPTDLRDLSIQRCQTLVVQSPSPNGLVSAEPEMFPDGPLLYVSEVIDDRRLLDYVVKRYELDVGDGEMDELVQSGRQVQAEERTRKIRDAESDADRLLEAVGKTVLKESLPEGLMDFIERKAETRPDDREVAQMFLNVHGVGSLQRLREDLHAKDLNPPSRFEGSVEARTFVAEHGFPEAFAGLPKTRYEPYVDVIGSFDLPPMHDFQKKASDGITRILNREVTPARGILELPTGAGKTRIVVETLVRWLNGLDRNGVVLWVAQSEELCEQAVEAWSEVWTSIGSRREKIRVSRLWGGRRAELAETRFHVVVATQQKLTALIKGEEEVGEEHYRWATDPLCLVIDEAHHSTTPAYTEILNWLDLGQVNDSRPMIGLTATAYRGYSESETVSLVNRYGRHRIDAGLGQEKQAYGQLQKLGVLCEVDHEEIKGADIELKDQHERDFIQQFQRLPSEAETRLGRDTVRNESILERLLGLPDDWPTLVFASSVEHARLLAGLVSVSDKNRRAAVVDAMTDAGVRRHYVEQFRAGDIQVLCNYGVFSAGFDAPATSVVMVARPVFSPGLYQQMIGRGLRGPMNGGKDRCLILNVADNIKQYGRSLAFNHFADLWAKAND